MCIGLLDVGNALPDSILRRTCGLVRDLHARAACRTSALKPSNGLANRSLLRWRFLTAIRLCRGFAALQNSHHSILRAQGDASLQRNLFAFLEPQVKSLREHGEDQYRFGHGEGCADAHSRAASEG